MQGKIHILFSCSAAASLRRALKEVGKDDEILYFSDDLSYGPITSLDPDVRQQGLIREGFTTEGPDWDWLPEISRDFWAKCAATNRQRILWMAPRAPNEMAGFLAYNDRFGDVPCEIVITDEAKEILPKREFAGDDIRQIGQLWPSHFAALLDRARPLQNQEVTSARQHWASLVEENAALRVPGGDGLVSEAETFLDEDILGECSYDWQSDARVLAGATGTIWNRRFTIGIDFLGWRLVKLIGQGVLESRDDFTSWSLMRPHTDIRLKKSAA
jgi:hypothetical protein